MAQVFLVTDHTKFNIKPMVKLGSFADIDALITQLPPPDAICTILAETKTRLILADGDL